MLNQQHTLAKLRTKIEKREERICWEYKRFRYLACNCRNKKKEMKGKPIPQNKFEVIASKAMQYRVKEEVRRQETEEKKVQCFRYWRIEYYKWKCPNFKVEKERRRSKKVACVISLQKVQPEKKLAYYIQRKVQKYSSIQGMSLESAALEKRDWKTRWEMVILVKYSRCDYKDTKTKENQRQGFVSREKLRNVQCKSCLEAQKQRNKKAKSKVKYTQYRRKDTIVGEKISEEKRRNIWCLECKTEKKRLQ